MNDGRLGASYLECHRIGDAPVRVEHGDRHRSRGGDVGRQDVRPQLGSRHEGGHPVRAVPANLRTGNEIAAGDGQGQGGSAGSHILRSESRNLGGPGLGVPQGDEAAVGEGIVVDHPRRPLHGRWDLDAAASLLDLHGCPTGRHLASQGQGLIVDRVIQGIGEAQNHLVARAGIDGEGRGRPLLEILHRGAERAHPKVLLLQVVEVGREHTYFIRAPTVFYCPKQRVEIENQPFLLLLGGIRPRIDIERYIVGSASTHIIEIEGFVIEIAIYTSGRDVIILDDGHYRGIEIPGRIYKGKGFLGGDLRIDRSF